MERLFQWQQKVAYYVLCVWYDNSAPQGDNIELHTFREIRWYYAHFIIFNLFGVHHPSYHYLEDHHAIIFNLGFEPVFFRISEPWRATIKTSPCKCCTDCSLLIWICIYYFILFYIIAYKITDKEKLTIRGRS